MTLLIFVGVAALLVLALYRQPGGVTASLALAFIVAVALSTFLPLAVLRINLALIDAALALGMLFAWAHFHCQYARVVGAISLLKCAWAVPYVVMPLPWNIYAAGINAAFVVQVLVAGGLADGLFAWAHHYLGRVRRGRSRGNRDVAQ